MITQPERSLDRASLSPVWWRSACGTPDWTLACERRLRKGGFGSCKDGQCQVIEEVKEEEHQGARGWVNGKNEQQSLMELDEFGGTG